MSQNETCVVPTCHGVRLSKEFCGAHYKQAQAGVSVEEMTEVRHELNRGKWNNEDGSRMQCQETGCDLPILTAGKCRHHYSNYRYMSGKGADKGSRRIKNVSYDGEPITCSFDECDRIRSNAGLCATHYSQKQKGWELRPIRARYPCTVNGCERTMTWGRIICAYHAAFAYRYGLSHEQCVEVFTEEPRCSNLACGSQENLHYDHDHSCCHTVPTCGGCNRGWLCQNCNLALGKLLDSPEIARGLADYVEQARRPRTYPGPS